MTNRRKITPRWIALLLQIAMVFATVHAGEDLPIGARSLAMGGTYVAFANTADAVFLNPGGLSQLTGTHLSVFYQKPFGLPDVNFGTVATSFKLLGYRLGLGFLTLGNEIYDETVVALAISQQFAQKINLGLGLKYHGKRIELHGSDATLGINIGFVVPLTPVIQFGFQADNINRPTIGQSRERLAQTMKTGIAFAPDPDIMLSIELFKDVRFSEEVRFGAEWKPMAVLHLRAGTANNPGRFSAGFGVTVKKFIIDYAFFTHNNLGITHQVSFSMQFGPKSQGED